jgi:hypothetical protein
MLRVLLALALASLSATPALRAQDDQSSLAGKVEGRLYVSPTGQFKVTIPILPELGGVITDTPNVVTFQDQFNVHVSIGAFAQDATQRWEMSTRGLKDYLVYFFSNFLVNDFKQNFEGVQIESAKFIPSMLDGALVAYLLVPGGTMFAHRTPSIGVRTSVPVAKRGNLLFVRNGHIFVISTELAERVIEGGAYNKTTAEEDDILVQKLNDIVGKMQLVRVATPAPDPAPAAAPSPAEKK